MARQAKLARLVIFAWLTRFTSLLNCALFDLLKKLARLVTSHCRNGEVVHQEYFLAYNPQTIFLIKFMQCVITILYHKVAAKHQSLFHIEEKTACLSGRHLYADALWFKVMRTPASPELV